MQHMDQGNLPKISLDYSKSKILSTQPNLHYTELYKT